MTETPPIYNEIWRTLNAGFNVVVYYSAAANMDDLYKRSRKLFDWIKKSGVKQESQIDLQFVNDSWLHVRKLVKHAPPMFFDSSATMKVFILGE